MKVSVCHLSGVRDVCRMPVLAGAPLEFAPSSFDLGTAPFCLLLFSDLHPTLSSAPLSVYALKKDSLWGPCARALSAQSLPASTTSI